MIDSRSGRVIEGSDNVLGGSRIFLQGACYGQPIDQIPHYG